MKLIGLRIKACRGRDCLSILGLAGRVAALGIIGNRVVAVAALPLEKFFLDVKNTAMRIARLDHLVLTVRDIEETCRFYSAILGMEVVTFGAGRRALSFGNQKLNLHEAGHELKPHAENPRPGSADLCFIAAIPLSAVVEHLRVCAVPVIEGPVERTGATGKIRSVYVRDPEKNLIEISEYV